MKRPVADLRGVVDLDPGQRRARRRRSRAAAPARRASCRACATRWASSAWRPGQVASISAGRDAERRGVALARGRDVAAGRSGSRAASRGAISESVASRSRARRTASRCSARRSRAGSRRSACRRTPRARRARARRRARRRRRSRRGSPPRGRARRASSIARSSLTAITSSSSSRLSTAGTKPAPMPWMRCGPGGAAAQHRRAPPARRRRCGSAGCARADGTAEAIVSACVRVASAVAVSPVGTAGGEAGAR